MTCGDAPLRAGALFAKAYNESAVKLEIEIDVPDGAVDEGAEAELIQSVKEQAALKLYSDERITTGEAAGMLGLTRIEFLDLLRRTGVGFRVELDDEDFAQIRQWREAPGRQSGR
jgi:predicted HTH domain antitoxin